MLILIIWLQWLSCTRNWSEKKNTSSCDNEIDLLHKGLSIQLNVIHLEMMHAILQSEFNA